MAKMCKSSNTWSKLILDQFLIFLHFETKSEFFPHDFSIENVNKDLLRFFYLLTQATKSHLRRDSDFKSSSIWMIWWAQIITTFTATSHWWIAIEIQVSSHIMRFRHHLGSISIKSDVLSVTSRFMNQTWYKFNWSRATLGGAL